MMQVQIQSIMAGNVAPASLTNVSWGGDTQDEPVNADDDAAW